MKNIEIKNPSKELIELFSLKEWRQRIHLYDNIFTPGYCLESEWDMCSLPNNLSGKSFLDVGANDGMLSFLAEKKGAKHVTSVDLYVDDLDTNLNMTTGWSINRINQLKKIKQSKLEVKRSSIHCLDQLNEKFDVVYCGNVLAWLENPMGGIKQLADATKNQLIIREDISKLKGKPALEFVNNDSFTACMFNANEAYYKTVLKHLGFKKIEFIPVDEYKLVEHKNKELPRFNLKKGTPILLNPFGKNSYSQLEENTKSTAMLSINNYYFFNMIGWIKIDDVGAKIDMNAPKNLIQKNIFEYKYRKSLLHNCVIFAEK